MAGTGRETENAVTCVARVMVMEEAAWRSPSPDYDGEYQDMVRAMRAWQEEMLRLCCGIGDERELITNELGEVLQMGEPEPLPRADFKPPYPIIPECRRSHAAHPRLSLGATPKRRQRIGHQPWMMRR